VEHRGRETLQEEPELSAEQVVRAVILSLMAPGAGHLYAWRPHLAAAAVACHALAAAALVAALVAAPNAAAVATACGAFAAIYVGIALHAGRIARGARAMVRPRGPILALLIAAFVTSSVAAQLFTKRWADAHIARAYRVSSPSMEPSLLVGDWLLALPRRGPITHGRMVIYRRAGKSYIKRAVGLPGDMLAMREGRVYRNGQSIEEPYASYDRSEVAAPAATWGPLRVPVGKVFVMGDNRNHALDSRHIGSIDVDSVVGFPVRLYFSRDPRTGAIRRERMGRGFR